MFLQIKVILCFLRVDPPKVLSELPEQITWSEGDTSKELTYKTDGKPKPRISRKKESTFIKKRHDRLQSWIFHLSPIKTAGCAHVWQRMLVEGNKSKFKLKSFVGKPDLKGLRHDILSHFLDGLNCS